MRSGVDTRKYLITGTVLFTGFAYAAFTFLYGFLLPYGIFPYLIAAAAVMVAVTWASHPFPSISSEPDEEFRTTSMLVTGVTIVSAIFSFLLILKYFGRYYELVMLIPLIPITSLLPSGNSNGKRKKRISTKRPVRSGIITLILSISAFILLFIPGVDVIFDLPLIGILAAVSVRSSAIAGKLENAGKKPLVPIFSIALGEVAFLSFPYFVGSGIILFPVVVSIVAFFGVLLVLLSRISLVSHINDALFLVIACASFPVLFFISYEYLFLALFIAIIGTSVMGRNVFDGQFRLMIKSLRIGESHIPAFPIIAVALLGTAYYSGTMPTLLSITSVNSFLPLFGPFLEFFTILLFLTALSRIGNGAGNAILFPASFFLFFWGLLSILSISYPGLWEPDFTESLVIALIISVVILYEPTFRIARSFTPRVPISLSISHQMGSSQYLHARYDVNLEKNKKKNKDLLGAGGFAYVFKGRDIIEDRDVVIKTPRVYDEESKGERERRELLQDAIRQLNSESKILSSLRYPGIVGFIESFKENNEFFLVEEFADGKNLSRFLGDSIRPGEKWAEKDILDFATKLLLSLNYMHMHEVYHRDLNPGNVVMSDSFPKIIDFGTSKTLLGRVSKSFFSHSQRVGVPCYHPPELDVDQRIPASASYDTYSLGALMCSMITGKFLDDEEMRRKYGVPFISAKYLTDEIEGRVSPRMFKTIKKTVSYNPEDRYQSAFEMISDLYDLKGEFIVTDLGHLYALNQDSKFRILLDPELRPPGGIMKADSTGDILLRENTRNGVVVAGAISFRESDGGYAVSAYQRRSTFRKKVGSLPEKNLVLTLEENYTYSLNSDFTGGTFSYFRRI